MKYCAYRGRVILRQHDVDKVSHGGIILLERAQVKPQRAEVVSAPADSLVEKGDTVYFRPGSGWEVIVDKVEYIVVKEEQIWAVVV